MLVWQIVASLPALAVGAILTAIAKFGEMDPNPQALFPFTVRFPGVAAEEKLMVMLFEDPLMV